MDEPQDPYIAPESAHGSLWGPPRPAGSPPLPPPPPPVPLFATEPEPAYPPVESSSGHRIRGMTLAVVVGVSAFALAAGVVVVLALRQSSEPGQAIQPPPIPPPVVVTTAPVVTTQSIPAPTPPPAAQAPPIATVSSSSGSPTAIPTRAPAGFRPVTGPGGVTLAIPEAWSIKPGAIPSNQQADKPASSTDYLRFGGSQSPANSLLDSVLESEHSVSTTRDGYQRLRLEQVAAATASDAVEWEFVFIKDGIPRHAFGRYWRLSGMDYVVYASSSAETWSAMGPVIDVMLRTAGP